MGVVGAPVSDHDQAGRDGLGVADIVARATAASGIVTAEAVPAFRAIGPGLSVGGLRLADPPR